MLTPKEYAIKRKRELWRKRQRKCRERKLAAGGQKRRASESVPGAEQRPDFE